MIFKYALLPLLVLKTVFAAPIPVVTTTTDLAWVVEQIGGGEVKVQSLLRGHENPHYVDAVPDYIRKASEAKLLCSIGLDLVVGWLPKVLSRSGNSQIQPGGQGFCETGANVSLLERPKNSIDRSMGDVHPQGNPHFWLNPLRLAEAAVPIEKSLEKISPEKKKTFQANLKKFQDHMQSIVDFHKRRLKPILDKYHGQPILLEYHKELVYFLDVYGLGSMGSLEEKPGVAPSAGRIAQVAMQAKQNQIQFLLAGTYTPENVLKKFQELSGIPYFLVPLSIQPGKGIKDYEALQTALVDVILKHTQNKPHASFKN